MKWTVRIPFYRQRDWSSQKEGTCPRSPGSQPGPLSLARLLLDRPATMSDPMPAFPPIMCIREFVSIPSSWWKLSYCLCIYIVFSLTKQKVKCHQALLKNTNTDPIYPRRPEMINSIAEALGESYLYGCLPWPGINSIAYSVSADHREMQNGHSICTLILLSPCVFIK